MIKALLKRLVPEPVLVLRRRLKVAQLRREFASLSVQKAFTRVYRERLWGVNSDGFCSGSGSIGRAATSYTEYVRQFIRDNRVQIVVDLGCGDFRIGKSIAEVAPRYIGVDVVQEFIAHLQDRYGSATIEFRCCDITSEELPAGDCCLIRQVFQHLSNAEIAAVLPKLRAYRFCLIAEHYPPMTEGFVPNKDKPHGPDTRLLDHSAVVLSAPPFALESVQEVLAVEPEQWVVTPGETIRTFLVGNAKVSSISLNQEVA